VAVKIKSSVKVGNLKSSPNNKDELKLAEIYNKRFDKQDEQRQILWSTLCKYYFQRFIKTDATVLDLAAGYCEFINNIVCKKKLAVDLNPDTAKKANKDVRVYLASSDKLPKQLHNQVDVVFVSNFFEHLDSKNHLLDTLAEVRKVLKKDGKIMVLQPNIKLVGHKFWDFVDHSLPMTDKSLTEALELSGYRVSFIKSRFLPYTTSSILPVNSLLIRLYLRLPLIKWFLGKQTFVVADVA